MPGFLVPAVGRAIAPTVVGGMQRGGIAGAALRTVGNNLYIVWSNAQQNTIVRAALWAVRATLGITATTAAGILILDAIPGIDTIQIGGGGSGGHPGQVVKEWTANGVQFVRLSDGRMGAFSSKRGTWKYWRPKKPIVLYSGGSSSLNTLLRADRAAERQLRRLKKAIDRRFPSRPRSRTPHTTVIQETGAGSVQHAPRS